MKTTKSGRKFLAPSEKYDIWLQLVRGEVTIAQAAASAGVDRSVIMRIKKVAQEGALNGLAASKPGSGNRKEKQELAEAQAEIDRLSEAVKELAIKLTLAEGKERWG